MLRVRGDNRDQQASKVQQDIIHDVIFMKDGMKPLLDKFPERQKNNHVNNQVHPVGMQETIRKEPVPLVAVPYIVCAEFQLFEERRIP